MPENIIYRAGRNFNAGTIDIGGGESSKCRESIRTIGRAFERIDTFHMTTNGNIKSPKRFIKEINELFAADASIRISVDSHHIRLRTFKGSEELNELAKKYLNPEEFYELTVI
jgi:hypothetical protein